MDTALCVVPPGPCWDTIQRARHLARDETYHKWPPAIRLFHPFVPRKELSDVALEVAHVIQQHEIGPFDISLNEWVIIPHIEALEQEWDALANVGNEDNDNDDGVLPLSATREEREKEYVDRLIAREERVGRENRRKRQRRELFKEKRQQPDKQESTDDDDNDESVAKNTTRRYRKQSKEDSPRALLEKQKQMYEEFNGPCVVCLEPDPTSREKLKQLRELLQAKLVSDSNNNHNNNHNLHAYSPTSSVSNSFPMSSSSSSFETTNDYRPILPIGRFPTVSSAIETARKLKGLWEPLTFTATDLQLISVADNDKSSNSIITETRFRIPTKTPLETAPSSQDVDDESLVQFGCDAMVMLMGEEMKLDKDDTQFMAETLMKDGIPGGGASLANKNGTPQHLETNNEKEEEDTSGLEGWLDEEDETYDEGTVVVIGRTHFFTGEMRMYVGMPASSCLDSQDRVLGDTMGAKQRRKARPQNRVWRDEDYGSRK